MTKTISTIVCISILTIGSQVYADNYLFHDKAVVQMGEVFDPTNPTDDKSNGLFEFSGDPIEATSGKLVYYLKRVDTRSEFFEAMSIDAGLEARVGAFSAKSSFSQSRSVKFSEKSLVYVLHLKYTFGPERGGSFIRLSKTGKELMKSAKEADVMAKFLRIAGPEIVTQVERGSLTNIVYNFRCSSKEKKEALAASLSGSWGPSKGNVDLKSKTSSIDESSTYEVFAEHSRDIGFVKDITGIITNDPGNLSAIVEAVRLSCENLQPSKCPIVSFNTKRIDDVAEIALMPEADAIAAAIELNRLVTESLIDLQRQYDSVNLRFSTVSKLLSTLRPTDCIDGGMEALDEAKESLSTAMKNIMINASACKNANSVSELNVKSQKISRFEVAKYVKTPFVRYKNWISDPMRKDATNCSNSEHFNMHYSYHPTVEFLHPQLINKIRVVCKMKNGVTEVPRAIASNLGIIEVVPVGRIAGISKNGDIGSIWKREYHVRNRYVWGGHVDQFQGKEASDRNSWHKYESLLNYVLEIEDIDGGLHEVQLGSFASPPGS